MDEETRAYFEALRRDLGDLRGDVGELRGGLGDLRRDLDDLRDHMVEGFVAVDHRFDVVDQRFVVMETELKSYAGVLVEDLRHQLQAVAEMVVANSEAITDLRARLDAR